MGRLPPGAALAPVPIHKMGTIELVGLETSLVDRIGRIELPGPHGHG